MKNIELKYKIMCLNIAKIYIAKFNVLNEQFGMSTVNKIHMQKYVFMFKKYKFLDIY